MKANTATRILSHKITSYLPGVYDDVRSFVESNLYEIDFAYKEGEFFGLAMQRSSKLVKLLIDTYIKIELQKDPSSIEHIAAVRHKLKTILEQQISQSQYEFDELPSEIQEILAPWMPEDVESEVDVEDLAGLEEDIFTDYNDDNPDGSQELQIPEFCGWPDSLAHRHLSGESGNGVGAEAH